jgi:hypothetical protein
MQFFLEVVAKFIISVVVGLILVPLTVVVWLPIAAVQALYDEEPYVSAIRKRIEDAAGRVAQIGAFLAGGI